MRASRDTSLAMRSSCQTRALIRHASGQGTRPMRHPCRMAGRTRPCVPPCYEIGLKAKFDYDERKGVGACDRGPSGLGRRNMMEPLATKYKTVCMECAVSQIPRHQTRILNYLQSRTNPSSFQRPSPGTQCLTSTTPLRKQISKFRVDDPKYKTVHMKCAVSQIPRHQTRILNYLQSRTNLPRSNVPGPGRSVSRARRLYVSRIANSV